MAVPSPNPGMLLDAVNNFNLNLGECWLIGDSEADIGAANNAGCKSILLNNTIKEKTKMRYEPNQIKTNIYEAVKYILSLD